jgi:hypothetical protein
VSYNITPEAIAGGIANLPMVPRDKPYGYSWRKIQIGSFGRIKAARLTKGYPKTTDAINDTMSSPLAIATILEYEYSLIHPKPPSRDVELFLNQIITALQSNTP